MSEDQLRKALESTILETRLAAIEHAALDPARYANLVVDLIPKFPNEAYFVLERVSRFGDSIVPHLVALAESDGGEQIRLIAALGLANFKRVVDETPLLNAIHRRSEYQCLACRALAWLGDDRILPFLLAELRVTSPTADWDRLVSLVSAIETLGGSIPLFERERLIATGPPLTKKMLDAKRTA